jgi:hypothetical protein
MRVLVGPRTDLGSDAATTAVAHALAGPEGAVLSLTNVGVRTLSRSLTAAEVALLREALGGVDAIVGYVCRGSWLGAASAGGTADRGVLLVAVTDHANLTWRSPLTGPNDERVGPRFPSMTGVYAPEAVPDNVGAAEGMIVMRGVVAGVRDDRRLSAFEVEVAGGHGHLAASSELVPVVIVAAHAGLRVAAVVVAAGYE